MARFEQLSNYAEICECVRAWRVEGLTSVEIARRLNADDDFYPPKLGRFTPGMVRQYLCRQNLTPARRRKRTSPPLGPNEWSVSVLARELNVAKSTLYGWVRRGTVKATQHGGRQGQWVVFADDAAVRILRARARAGR